MTDREIKLLKAAQNARLVLSDLAKHPAFEEHDEDSPEFNEGGSGTTAMQELKTALDGYGLR